MATRTEKAHAQLAKVHALWAEQGRPTRGPVVLRRGLLLTEADGTRSMRSWIWDFTYVEGEDLDPDELWTFLAERYPVITLPA